MNGTTDKKLVGKVRNIFLDYGVFGTTTKCCLLPGQTISVEGVEGLHSIDSLEIDHMRHDMVSVGDKVAIKAVTIPIGWVAYDARIWLHKEAEAKPAADPPSEHTTWNRITGRFRLDG